MSRIRAKDTKPELVVRRLIHSLGYRYRLHKRDLPGWPDVVFSSRHAVIFVHGCFWHRHNCDAGARSPKSRLTYWLPKLNGNKKRDKRNRSNLTRSGWRVLVIWECELANEKNLEAQVRKFLGPP